MGGNYPVTYPAGYPATPRFPRANGGPFIMEPPPLGANRAIVGADASTIADPSPAAPQPFLASTTPFPAINVTPPNKPAGWYYDGRLMRSDTQYFNNIGIGAPAGTKNALLTFNPIVFFEWAVDTYITAAMLSITLEAGTSAQNAEAGIFIVQNADTTWTIPDIGLITVPGNANATGAILGATISSNATLIPALTINSVSKTVGNNFYPAPFFVPARAPVRIFQFVVTPNVVSLNWSIYGYATLFSIPAN